MLKYILAGVVFLVGVTAAFYGGIFVGRMQPDPPLGVPPAPADDYWTYPDAREWGRIGGNGHYLATLVTPDDFDKVARFYHERISSAVGLGGGNFDPQREGGSSTGSQWGSYSETSDSRQSDGGGPRKVRVHSFAVRSQMFDLTVFVNRAEGEGHTHVTLSYDRKSAP
jgi:hypothetical protein